MEKLKLKAKPRPCPFCGGSPTIILREETFYFPSENYTRDAKLEEYEVTCRQCPPNRQVKVSASSLEYAVSLWNEEAS